MLILKVSFGKLKSRFPPLEPYRIKLMTGIEIIKD